MRRGARVEGGEAACAAEERSKSLEEGNTRDDTRGPTHRLRDSERWPRRTFPRCGTESEREKRGGYEAHAKFSEGGETQGRRAAGRGVAERAEKGATGVPTHRLRMEAHAAKR